MYDIEIEFLSNETISRKCVKEFSITSDSDIHNNKIQLTVMRLSNRIDTEIFRNVRHIYIKPSVRGL